MSYINKPKVAHPSLPTNTLGLTRRQYEGSMSTLCAGCGHDSVTASIIEACWGLSMRPEQLVKLSGIGCSSKTTAYFVSGSHGFNSVHGRMPSIASGANAANRAPDLCRRLGRRRFAVHRHRSAGACHSPQREHAVLDRKQRRLRIDQGSVLGLRRYRHQGEARRRQFIAADRSRAPGADFGRDLRCAQLLRRQGAARSAHSSRAAPQWICA